MRRHVMATALMLLTLSSLASSCSRAANRYDTATINRLRAKFQGVTVVVRPFTPRKQGQEWSDAPQHIAVTRATTVSYLQDKRIFGNVLMTAPQAAPGRVVVVDAVLEDYRIVSGAARFWGGALAGKSFMTYTVRLTDGASGSPITTQRIESSNNPYAASWVGGASDRSMPADMGAIIGEFVIRTLEAMP